MTTTVTRMYDKFSDARAAVGELEAMGYSHAQISLVANNADGAHSHPIPAVKAASETEAGVDAGRGAAVGGVVGGAGGMLAGLGLIIIPGLGPVAATGWLVSMIVGAAVGAATAGAATGLVSALTRTGLDEHEAKVFAEGIRQGGTVVCVHAQTADADTAAKAMERFNPVDIHGRGDAYRLAGWG